jgi:hypothetical protein
MKAEEIRAITEMLKEAFGCKTDDSAAIIKPELDGNFTNEIEVLTSLALMEIAYQLAISNERQEKEQALRNLLIERGIQTVESARGAMRSSTNQAPQEPSAVADGVPRDAKGNPIELE